MPKLINNCHSAFNKDRFISDKVSLLQEILKKTKYKKQQGVVLKIDFEKLTTK
jgi:hypothetical protein